MKQSGKPNLPKEFTMPGVPIAKPRQTQRDKWQKRPSVMRYRAWADELRLRAGKIDPDAVMVTVRFFLPMPDSWTKAKQVRLDGLFHGQKPDIDNLAKAVLDALFASDQQIASLDAAKFWCTKDEARTIIRIS